MSSADTLWLWLCSRHLSSVILTCSSNLEDMHWSRSCRWTKTSQIASRGQACLEIMSADLNEPHPSRQSAQDLYSGKIMTLGLGKQCQTQDGSTQQQFEETRAMWSLDTDEHFVPCFGYKVDTHSLIRHWSVQPAGILSIVTVSHSQWAVLSNKQEEICPVESRRKGMAWSKEWMRSGNL